MNLATIESRLVVAERHIVESRDQISRQKLIVGDLENSRRNSMTAIVARKLLESLHNELKQHTADRDRLRRWLERRQGAAQVPCLGQDCYIVRDANGHALAYVYLRTIRDGAGSAPDDAPSCLPKVLRKSVNPGPSTNLDAVADSTGLVVAH